MGCFASTGVQADDPIDSPQAPAKSASPSAEEVKVVPAPQSDAPAKKLTLAAEKKPKAVKKVGKGIDKDFPFVPGEHNVNDVWKFFKRIRTLGKGASCEVIHVIRKSDGVNFAMKQMERDDKWNPILFEQEVHLLEALKHPNILRYRDCYMDNKNFYVCTELCTGGELFDRIKKEKKFTEKDAAGILKTIVEAIHHCHQLDIVHRDLKPENIVYATEEQKELVIIDFGDAKKIDNDKTYEDFVGTAFYLAPECTRNRKGWELKASDMWTIGVIAYVLMTGRPPFYGRGNKEILKKIVKCQLTFPQSTKLSKQAVDFITKLIEKKTAKRMTAEQALNHEFLTGKGSDTVLDVLTQLGNYQSQCKLKKVLVRMLANQMNEEDHDNIQTDFEELDKDGNGFVDVKEIAQYIIKKSGVGRQEADRRASEFIRELDQDGDGKISKEEFTDGRLSKMIQDEEEIQKHFKHIDKDRDGFINEAELAELFNNSLSKHLIKAMIEEVDQNGDGMISYPEFRKAMMQGNIGGPGVGVLSPRLPMAAEATKKFMNQLNKEVEEEERH